MKPIIILPQNIVILRDKLNQDIIINREEYSIYYKNILHPYSVDYDVKIKCKYGKNLGFCWRLDDFSECAGSFCLTVCVYLFGELIAEKTVNVAIVEHTEKPLSLLCVGDSMTMSEVYIEQAVKKAENITTLGSQCIGLVNHEGRGGYTLNQYLNVYKNDGWFVSPFLFPENVRGKDYYGDVSYWEDVRNAPNKYTNAGSLYEPIRDGMYALKGSVLCKYENGTYTEIDKNPKFAFDFAKYRERYNIETPDVITLLFGANDLQRTPYEETHGQIKVMLAELEELVVAFKSCGAKIVINLPVCGADQVSWGNRCKCDGTVKQYDYNMKMWSQAILDNYDNREDEGIYICPMIAVCDTEHGFPNATSSANLYSDIQIKHLNNWVHPNEVGYKQMGDALAGVITKIKGLIS